MAMHAQTVEKEAEEIRSSGGGVARPGSQRHARGGRDLPNREERPSSQFDLYSDEERHRQATASHQPSLGELSPQENSLQNDDHEGCQGGNYQKVLDGKNRSEGLFLANTGGQERPTNPLLPLEGHQLQLQNTTIWPECFPDVYHQSFQADYQRTTPTRPPSDDIYRRYASDWKHKERVRTSSGGCFGTVQRIGSGRKRREIMLVPFYEDGLPRVPYQLRRDDNYSPYVQDKEFEKGFEKVLEPQQLFTQGLSLSPGQDQLTSRCPLPSTSSYFGPTRPQNSPSQATQVLGGFVTPIARGKRGREMVVGECDQHERPLSYPLYTRHPSGNGCFRRGMGGLDNYNQRREAELRWTVQPTSFDRAYQLQGTNSSSLLASQLPCNVREQGYRPGDRQYNNNVLHQPDGGQAHTLGKSGDSNLGDVRNTSRDHFCASYPGRAEPNSRLRVKERSPCLGLETQPHSLQCHQRRVGAAHGGLVLNGGEQTNTSLRQLETQSELHLRRRLHPQLGGGERLDQSPLLSHPSYTAENTTGTINSNDNSSSLANTTVVSSSAANASRRSYHSTEEKRPVSPSSSSNTSSSSSSSSSSDGEASAVVNNRLQDIREALLNQDVEEQVIEHLFASWDKSTIKQYNQIWRAWKQFTKDEGVELFTSHKHSLAYFLSQLISRGLSQGTITKYKDVIASTIDIVTNPDSVLAKMSQASAKINAPVGKRYDEMWDIAYAFQYMFDLPKPNNIKAAIERAIVLLKSTLGWRAADLAGVTRSWGIRKFNRGLELRFWNGKKTKNAWTGWSRLYKLSEKFATICPVRAVETLLEMVPIEKVDTIQVQQDVDKEKTYDAPLICYAKPDQDGMHRCLIDKTISKKAQELLLDNVKDKTSKGEEPFSKFWKPHSFRHSTASAWHDMKVPSKKLPLTCSQARTL